MKKNKKLIIIGSGSSVINFVIPEGVDTITVNSAIKQFPNSTYWFTLDPRPLTHIILDETVKAKKFVAPFKGFVLPKDVTRCFRVETKRPRLPKDNSWEYFLSWSAATFGLSKDTKKLAISNGNSGYGALNLAYHLGYKDIALIGIDGIDTHNVHSGGKSGDYLFLDKLFSTMVDDLKKEGIRVVSLGHLKTFSKMTLKEWLKC